MDKNKKDKIEEIKTYLLNRGYIKDNWGNYIKNKKIRFKFLPNVLRLEFKYPERGWVRHFSKSYNLLYIKNNKISSKKDGE